eukprot:5208612-Karenia_brevis.AAC.1
MHAGIDVNLGKCRCWNSGGQEPTHMRQLGASVWIGGQDTPVEERGLMVLGSPLGCPEYVREQGRLRLMKEQRSLDMIKQ